MAEKKKKEPSERWLFVQSDIRDALRKKKIPYDVITIDSPMTASGIAFPETSAKQVIDILKVKTLGKAIKTNVPGVFFINPSSDKEDGEETYPVVVSDSSEMGCWKVLKTVIQKFANDTKLSIFCSVPHGTSSKVMCEEGKLFVRFWSVPNIGPAKKIKIRHLFGFDVDDGTQDAFLPCTAAGGVIFSEDIKGKKSCYAQLVGTTLFVLFDLPHTLSSNNREKIFMEKILDECKQYIGTSSKMSEFISDYKTGYTQLSKKLYIDECSKRVEAQFKQLEAHLQKWSTEINVTTSRLSEAIKTHKEYHDTYEVLSANKEKLLEKTRFSREYDKLLQHPLIKEINVNPGSISIITNNLLSTPLKKDKTIRNLGEYDIIINTTSGNMGITVHNISRKVGGKHHPHDMGDGRMCLGNIQEAVSKLMGGYEFAVLAGLLIEYLMNVNEEDTAGRSVYNWPVFEG